MGADEFQEMVATFNKSIGTGPDIELRVKLIQEEAEEFDSAVKNRDLVETVDALCDLLYVVYGAADVFNINLDTLEAPQAPTVPGVKWELVHSQLGDFNDEVNDVVVCLRNLDSLGNLNRYLTGLAQGLWVCSAEGFGIDLRPFFREVHRTNMLKLTGPKREDGKQLKPPGWEPPRIKAMLEQLHNEKNV